MCRMYKSYKFLSCCRWSGSPRAADVLMRTNDLWIAAASLQHELCLVTANAADFGRVSGLEVVPYR